MAPIPFDMTQAETTFREFATLSRRLTHLTALLEKGASRNSTIARMISQAIEDEATTNLVLEALEGTSFVSVLLLIVVFAVGGYFVWRKLDDVWDELELVAAQQRRLDLDLTAARKTEIQPEGKGTCLDNFTEFWNFNLLLILIRRTSGPRRSP